MLEYVLALIVPACRFYRLNKLVTSPDEIAVTPSVLIYNLNVKLSLRLNCSISFFKTAAQPAYC